MNDRHESDAVEQLVAEYLKAEAETVDGRALVDRVRETRRRRRTRRRVGVLFATAAAAVIAVTLGLMALPDRPSRQEPPNIIAPIANHAEEMAGSLRTVGLAVSALRPVMRDFEHAIPTSPKSGMGRAVGGLKASFANDAAYMSGKLRASIRDVLDRAGLIL